MTKQTIEVDVPDGWEIQDFDEDYPKRLLQVCPEGRGSGRIVIEAYLKQAWQAPSFLPSGWWIAMDKDGRWFMYENAPSLFCDQWVKKSSTSDHVNIGRFNWTPPEATNWKESKRQIP